MSNNYTAAVMTDKARNELMKWFEEVAQEYLRAFRRFADEDKYSMKIEQRKGQPIDSFLYNLGLSLDHIPFIMKCQRLPRLEQTLARLDMVDGTENEWGMLAQGLLNGLEIEMNKQTVVKNFPDEEWGFVKYHQSQARDMGSKIEES